MSDDLDRNDEEAFPSAARLVQADDEEEDGDYADDGDNPSALSIHRQRRKSIHKEKGRRRRRSSARFLRLTPSEDHDLLGNTLSNSSRGAGGGGGGGDDDGDGPTSATNLGEVYQKAIRMNAENRINGANSWNLSLIDHLDRVIADDIGGDDTTTANPSGTNQSNQHHHRNPRGGGSLFTNSSMEESLTTASLATGINFTKASCTLDASVKIYSYRVDDVHLSSYKVLANLNRTDNGNSSSSNKAANANAGSITNDAASNGDEDGHTNGSKKASNKTAAATETLEHNLANINIHKLDAAFDIDPLFHKMSKTFDEGGAKGLLLANLGVSRSGCNIVFDSTLEEEQPVGGPAAAEDSKEGNDAVESNNEITTSVDVTSLVKKLDALLLAQGQTIEDIPLVPQLASLRNEFAILEQEGYVDHVQATDRYASSHEEEVEADRSIHLEAMERSRASLGRSLLAQEQSYRDGSVRSSMDSCPESYAPDDFGGGGGDFDDRDDNHAADGDGLFGGSMIHDGDHRFSSSSFQASFIDPQQTQPSQATVLLDAIASGDITISQTNNPYEYFNSQALQNLSTMSGNLWAGAEHWKTMASSTIRRRKVVGNNMASQDAAAAVDQGGKKKKGSKAKKNIKGGDRPALIDITKPVENLKEFLQKPKKSGKTKTTNDPLRLTKAMKTKYEKMDNLLPLDAGLGVEQLTTLFLRPNVNLAEMAAAAPTNKQSTIRSGVSTPKTVGFGGVETWGNRSYEDHDDDGGAGFDFGSGGGDHDDRDEPEDFVIPNLEDVRKVEKIKVGYATVAKKIDVKRLKQDLWNELEQTFQRQRDKCEENAETSVENNDEDEKTPTDETQMSVTKDRKLDGPLSFQETVRDMQATQSQSDVTLSFYFICILHLCNEKGLALESCGLDDFVIHNS